MREIYPSAPCFFEYEPKEFLNKDFTIEIVAVPYREHDILIPAGATHVSVNFRTYSDCCDVDDLEFTFTQKVAIKNLGYEQQLQSYNKRKAKFEVNYQKWAKGKAEFDAKEKVRDKELRKQAYLKLKEEFEDEV